MSLGEPHAETDKSGSGCTVYDIVVHTQFLEKMKTSEVFKAFFLSVSMEGIEDKFKTTIDRSKCWLSLDIDDLLFKKQNLSLFVYHALHHSHP